MMNHLGRIRKNDTEKNLILGMGNTCSTKNPPHMVQWQLQDAINIKNLNHVKNMLTDKSIKNKQTK